MNTINTKKKNYNAPAAARRRVFLEEGIAASAEELFSGASAIQQTDWTDVTDEIAGAGTDKQGDILWFGY
jgi:hypothetical protein